MQELIKLNIGKITILYTYIENLHGIKINVLLNYHVINVLYKIMEDEEIH